MLSSHVTQFQAPTMLFSKVFAPFAVAIASASVVKCGPIAYGICQTGAFISTIVNKSSR